MKKVIVISQQHYNVEKEIRITLPADWYSDTAIKARIEDVLEIYDLPEEVSIKYSRNQFIEELRNLLKAGKKIEAIKMVRVAMNWGLKDAKDFVEALE